MNKLFHGIDILTSTASTALRFGMGVNTDPATLQPDQTLELYEFENCPFCRLVREALTELDLDAIIYPCPKGGQRFRPTVSKLGGKQQFPFLVDANQNVAMYESLDIVRYLFETYGQRPLPARWRVAPAQVIGSSLSGIPRPWQGRMVRGSRQPEKLLELYSFESSPYARPVRELLSEMEIPYLLRNCGRGAIGDWVPPPVRDLTGIKPSSGLRNRAALMERAGRVSIPYLVDPNTGNSMAQSADIVEYLKKTYGK